MLTDNNEVSLYISDKKFSGWKSVSISRSLEAASGAFNLDVVDYNPEIQKEYKIRAGEECRVLIGNDTVITGYIDSAKASISSDSFGVSISGRDRTADLVDCSVSGKPEYRNKSLISIAREFCKPFNIPVLSEDGQDAELSVRINPKAARSIAQKARRRKKQSGVFAGENIKTFRSQPGETVLETLERVAKEKGVLITSTPNGELLFTRSGKNSSGATIREGENLLGGDSEENHKDRFSDYIVNGQQPGVEGVGNRWSAFKSQTKDQAVKRYRPLIILAENAMGHSGAKRRATWEASVRAAKSFSTNLEVTEWRDDNGNLWEVNTLVKVESPSLRLDRELLITDVTFNLSDSGRTTSLQLKRPDAYLLESDIVLENNEPIKPSSPVKKPSKRKSVKPPRRKKTKPKPNSNSRDMVLNTNTIGGDTLA